MSGAERAMRWSTIAAVTAVAAVAGWVSYEHALAVVRAHGEAGAVAQVYPITVDGLIYSASMVLLDAARRGARAPRLARWLLGLGITATLAANVTAGLHFGLAGAIVAAWPAVALVGSYELLMLIIRSGTKSAPGVRISAPEIQESAHGSEAEIGKDLADLAPVVPDVAAAVPDPQTEPEPEPERPSADAEFDRLLQWLTSGGDDVPGVPELHQEAEALFAADLVAGRVPAIRAIREGLRVGQDKATQVQNHLRALASTR